MFRVSLLYLVLLFSPISFSFGFAEKKTLPEIDIRENLSRGKSMETDTALANEYQQKGIAFSKQQEFDSGAYYFELSREIFQQYDLWEKYIAASANLVLNLIYLDKMDNASQINQNLIRIFKREQITDTVTFKRLLNFQGGIYSITKKLDSAIIVTKKLLALDKLFFKGKPDMLLGGTYHNLGTLYTDYEMLDVALQYYDSAEAIYYQLNAKESEEAARLYSNKAIVLKLLGNYEESLTFNKRSYEIFKTFLKPDHPRLALALFNIGNDLIDRNKSKLDNSEGIDYLNQGFEVMKKGKNLSHRYITDYYRFTAKAYTNLEEYDHAIDNLEKALAKSIEINGDGYVEQARIYEELSEIYIKKQADGLALEYLNKSKTIYESEISKDFKRIANIYDLKGLLFARLGQYDEALKHYQIALSYFAPQTDTTNFFNNPDVETLTTHENLFIVLKNKAESLNNAYQVNQKRTYLEAAFDTYLLLDDYVQNSRKNFPDRYTKLEFTESKGDFYEDGIETGLLLYENMHDQKTLENALQLADHYKSILLLEELEYNKAKMFANLPQPLVNEEKELKGAINYTRQELFEMKQAGEDKRDEKSIKALEAKLFNQKTDLEFLIKTIEQQYPAYYQLKYRQDLLDISGFRKRAIKDTDVLLQYFVGEKNLYVWIVNQNQTDYVIFPRTESLEAEVQTFLNSLKNSNFNVYSRSGYVLFQLLLEPVLAKISNPKLKHLLIIPDGILGYLPFETLITQKPERGHGYRDLAYLIKDYEISYHYSASLLLFEHSRENRPSNTFIGFAPSFRDDTDKQLLTFNETVRSYIDSARALPFAEEEVSSIASLLGGRATLGIQATEHNFKQFASDYRIIHLASHSLIDDVDPLYSKLIFDSEHDSIDDGLLHTFELYNMQLNADLVCLSACNTGVGKYYKGEGIVSLARGFMYAGVPNVTMSLWPVADRPTKDIMQYYYEELNKGTPYSKAMRLAKLRYLETADDLTANPYYWGAFIYLGQTSEGISRQNRKPWLLAGIALALFIGLAGGRIYFGRRKKQALV